VTPVQDSKTGGEYLARQVMTIPSSRFLSETDAMSLRLYSLPLAMVAILSLTLTGCVGQALQQARQAAQRQNLMNDLKQLGLAFHNYHDAKGQLPNSWAELQSFGIPAGLQQKLEAEGYTVIFGMKFKDMTAGTSRFMLVFRRDAAQKGGLVLLADGSVMNLTPEDFNAYWKDQEPTMTSAIVVEPPGGGTAAPAASGTGGGSAPPPPPTGSY
jgi:hypothetical protein